MKRKYNSPKLTLIGDMINNTLGASGNSPDGGSLQSGGQGRTNNNDFNRRSFNSGGFDNSAFDK